MQPGRASSQACKNALAEYVAADTGSQAGKLFIHLGPARAACCMVLLYSKYSKVAYSTLNLLLCTHFVMVAPAQTPAPAQSVLSVCYKGILRAQNSQTWKSAKAEHAVRHVRKSGKRLSCCRPNLGGLSEWQWISSIATTHSLYAT